MKTIEFTAFPYASVRGYIEVPDELPTTWESLYDYVHGHWEDVELDERNIELDYYSTDLEFDEYEE